MLKGQDASSLEFPTWNPALSFGKTQNELLRTIYIGIIEAISDTLSVDYDKDAMTRDLERVQSMLFSVSHQKMLLSDSNIQKKLGLFYAYCQKQVKLSIEDKDCSHIEELPGHFTQLVNTIELCPINIPPDLH